jgi:hypothetical protein
MGADAIQAAIERGIQLVFVVCSHCATALTTWRAVVRELLATGKTIGLQRDSIRIYAGVIV